MLLVNLMDLMDLSQPGRKKLRTHHSWQGRW
jgi:hypothetical protein